MKKEEGIQLNNIREQLREKGMYEEADTIRDVLKSNGFEIKDGKGIYKSYDRIEALKKQEDDLLKELAYYSSRYRILKNHIKGELLSTQDKKYINKLTN